MHSPELKTKSFSLLMIAAAAARVSARLISIAFILYAIDIFRSPVIAGWVTFFAFAPGLVISPFAGVVLDRYGEKTSITIDLALNALIVGAVLWLVWHSALTETNMLVLAALLSTTGPLGMAGIRRMVPRLVPREMLDKANAIDTAIFTAADVIGPAMLGILLYVSGYSVVFLVCLTLYLTAATAMVMIEIEKPRFRTRYHFMHEAAEGIWLVVKNPTLRSLSITYTLYQVTWGIVIVAVPSVIKSSQLTVDSDLLVGLLWALVGFAGAIGALVTGYIRTEGRERVVMAIGAVFTAVAAWPFMGSQSLVFLIFGLIIAGCFMGPVDVALLSLRQRRTDPAILGRVLSVSISLNLAGYPIGGVIGGWFVNSSPSLAFAIAAGFSLAATGFSLMIPKLQAQPTIFRSVP